MTTPANFYIGLAAVRSYLIIANKASSDYENFITGDCFLLVCYSQIRCI